MEIFFLTLLNIEQHGVGQWNWDVRFVMSLMNKEVGPKGTAYT